MTPKHPNLVSRSEDFTYEIATMDNTHDCGLVLRETCPMAQELAHRAGEAHQSHQLPAAGLDELLLVLIAGYSFLSWYCACYWNSLLCHVQ